MTTAETPTVSLLDVATYLPPERVPAEWYAQFAGADELRDNLMFRAPQFRHHAAFEETNVDMMVSATEGLRARHGDVLTDVDVLLTHSQLPDLPILGAGGALARRLGIDPRFVIDVHNGGCAAFVLMLDLARELLRGGAGRTALIVSHRLSAVMDADHILVLKDGRIAEQGDHASLLALDGWYASQWRYQQLEASLDAA